MRESFHPRGLLRVMTSAKGRVSPRRGLGVCEILRRAWKRSSQWGVLCRGVMLGFFEPPRKSLQPTCDSRLLNYTAIQMTVTTMSMPLASPPSYLKLQSPSFFWSQNACVAECMPRRPTWGFPSVAVASELVVMCGSSDLASLPPFGLLRADVGTRCCTMVLLTTYLCEGAVPAGVDSPMTFLRMLFCGRGRWGQGQRWARIRALGIAAGDAGSRSKRQTAKTAEPRSQHWLPL